MTIIAAPAYSWVRIDLDTTPPLLVLDAPSTVEPPDDWIVLVKANEDLGPVGVAFTDAYGTIYRLGYERVSARLLAVRVPTVGLSSGAGELSVVARDRACNATTVTATVVITRPRAFDAVLTIEPVQEAVVTVDGAFEVESLIGPAASVQETLDHAYEAEAVTEAAFAVTLEIT